MCAMDMGHHTHHDRRRRIDHILFQSIFLFVYNIDNQNRIYIFIDGLRLTTTKLQFSTNTAHFQSELRTKIVKFHIGCDYVKL